MKIARLSLLCISILALPVFSVAQGVKLPPRGHYKHKKAIEVDYDKFKDVTTVAVGNLNIVSAFYGPLDIVAAFSYPGHTLKTPARVAFVFFSESNTWRFLDDRAFLVLADGKRFDFGMAEVVKRGTVKRPNALNVTEKLVAFLPIDDFLQIINASKVEIRLGQIEARLAPDHLEALRDLASRMSPQ